jgi:hypothetical protein
VHGAIYKERGLLTAGGKEIKNKAEILQQLEAVWEQSRVAVMHCRGQQRGMDCVSRGNCLADQEAKRAAEELSSPKCQSKPPSFCWLWSCLPLQVTPRRKNNGQKMKRE